MNVTPLVLTVKQLVQKWLNITVEKNLQYTNNVTKSNNIKLDYILNAKSNNLILLKYAITTNCTNYFFSQNERNS